MDWDHVIEVRLEPGDLRVCDYCNVELVDKGAIVVKDCYSTQYGHMCTRCKGSIEAISSHSLGDDVSNEPWYLGGVMNET